MNNVIKEMLTDRKYECIRDLDMYYRKSDKNMLKVFIPTEEKIGINSVKTMVNDIENEESNVNTVIIIYQTSVTPFAKQSLESYQNQNSIKFELFRKKELSFNVTKHVKVPKHELLSLKDVKTLYEVLKTNQIPRISIQDPVARYYGASIGNVLKITRNSETAGRCIVYRKVY
tara:strand:- start:1672 stop:2190 length:519 start_codon:yes stop_codon:yes gene_type:complete